MVHRIQQVLYHCVETFILHLNRGRELLSYILLVPIPVPVSVPPSVITRAGYLPLAGGAPFGR